MCCVCLHESRQGLQQPHPPIYVLVWRRPDDVSVHFDSLSVLQDHRIANPTQSRMKFIWLARERGASNCVGPSARRFTAGNSRKEQPPPRQFQQDGAAHGDARCARPELARRLRRERLVEVVLYPDTRQIDDNVGFSANKRPFRVDEPRFDRWISLQFRKFAEL